MAKHLPGKVARAIGDFMTIVELTNLIEHEMEKRIVARHGLVKLDALLSLLPRLKNDLRGALAQQQKRDVTELGRLIARLRNDYDKSLMETGRDAFAAHSLHLDLMRIVETWKSMGETTFGVLASDLQDIDDELRQLSSAHPNALPYPGASAASVVSEWPVFWSHQTRLGDPCQPRHVVIYPGLATAGINSFVPGGHPAQDATIRAIGLATFLRQVHILLQAVSRGGEVERLFAEMMVNDYFALWELLFKSGVQNEHGKTDLSVLEHWQAGGWDGADCLKALETAPHPDLERWRQDVRNKSTAHIDAEADIWTADLQRWPMTIDELAAEVGRVVEAFRTCASHDIRSRTLFMPPTPIRDVVGLTHQEGRYWRDG